MNSTNCHRCKSSFYTAIEIDNISCPFCGYSFGKIELENRKEKREVLIKDCILKNGFGMISAKTIDVSKAGVGVKVEKGFLPFSINDNIYIDITDLEVYSRAQIVWKKKISDEISWAGLRFC